MNTLAASSHQRPDRFRRALFMAAVIEAAVIGGFVLASLHHVSRPATVKARIPVHLTSVPLPHPKPKARTVTKPKPHPKPKPVHHVKPHPHPRQVHPKPAPKPVVRPKPVPTPARPVKASAPPPPAAPDVNVMTRFEAAVRSAVQQALQYPRVARMMSLQGRVQVLITLANGQFAGVRIVTRSPHGFFNKAALAAVRDAKWPSVPAQIAHKTVTLQLWVRFRLVHGG